MRLADAFAIVTINGNNRKMVLSMKYLFAVLVIICCMNSPALAAEEISCDYCKKLEEEIVSLELKRRNLESDVRTYHEKKEYSRVRERTDAINAVIKDTVEKQRQKEKDCKDACKPENVLTHDIKKLIQEIHELEKENTNTDIIDEKYRELAHKNLQLDDVLEKKKK